MKRRLPGRGLILLLLADSILLAGAYYCSYLVRFEADIPAKHMLTMSRTMALIIGFKILVFYLFSLYRGMWRYTGIVDLFNLMKATLVNSAMIVTVILFLHRFEGFSRAVFVIDAVFTLLFIGGLRLLIRLGYSTGFSLWLFDSKKSELRKARLMIVGAGDAGERIVREFHDKPHLGYAAIGFVDDSPEKIGKLVHGVPVLGTIDEMPDICRKHLIEEILIAIPTTGRRTMRRIIDRCDETHLKFRTIPGLGELIDGRISINAIRNVSYNDLLGRDPVTIDQAAVSQYLKGKTILITGAGGSIGSELCRQVSMFNPEMMLLMDSSESSLYQIDMELNERFPYVRFIPLLGQIQDKAFLDKAFDQYRPEIVFHASAYKQVPLLEINPWEGVYNNIVGTKVLMDCAHNHYVNRFVLVSTDKAVRPTNVMGACKRVTELMMQAYSGNGWKTRYMAVRFGNVIGSTGSVVPIFKKQIEMGGPLTVTHPDIKRYFMTVQEATQLILQAMSMGRGGEVFVLDMGVPIKISDMARDLIKLYGLEPDSDIEIKYVGLRPGEKLYEELITQDEGITKTAHAKILMLRRNGKAEGLLARPQQPKQEKRKGESICSKPYERHEPYEANSAAWLAHHVMELVEFANARDSKAIKSKLKEIVPEYEPQDTWSVL